MMNLPVLFITIVSILYSHCVHHRDAPKIKGEVIRWIKPLSPHPIISYTTSINTMNLAFIDKDCWSKVFSPGILMRNLFEDLRCSWAWWSICAGCDLDVAYSHKGMHHALVRSNESLHFSLSDGHGTDSPVGQQSIGSHCCNTPETSHVRFVAPTSWKNDEQHWTPSTWA